MCYYKNSSVICVEVFLAPPHDVLSGVVMKRRAVLISAYFMLGILISPEDGGDVFQRNID
jgi:hypothetical protein